VQRLLAWKDTRADSFSGGGIIFDMLPAPAVRQASPRVSSMRSVRQAITQNSIHVEDTDESAEAGSTEQTAVASAESENMPVDHELPPNAVTQQAVEVGSQQSGGDVAPHTASRTRTQSLRAHATDAAAAVAAGAATAQPPGEP
jgi:Tfp pilus assembly protein PilW